MFKHLKINIIFVIISILTYCSFAIDDYIDQVNRKSSIGNIPNDTVLTVSNFYLDNNLGPLNYISGQQLNNSHRQFNANRANLIQQWEQQLNEDWPTYQEDSLCFIDHTCYWKKPGYKYDAHHLIPQSHRGPNLWWNIWPLSSTEHSKIHSEDGPCCNIFPKSCGNRGTDIRIREYFVGWTKTGKSSLKKDINGKAVMITKVKKEGQKKQYNVSLDKQYIGHSLDTLEEAKKEAVLKAFELI